MLIFEIFVEKKKRGNSEIYEKSNEKRKILKKMKRDNLRVLRVETWSTVYRSLAIKMGANKNGAPPPENGRVEDVLQDELDEK